MRVAFQNLEPQLKNYAQEKLRLYHESEGDECLDYTNIEAHTYDRIYCSSIFTFTDKSNADPRAICGGTGFDVKSKLPDEIDRLRPRCNYGFCSRGCIRNCPFCVVPQKEGYVHEEAEIYDVWDGQSKNLVLYDNNILALPDHFERICEQIHKEKLCIDFNQGLDIRLLNGDVAELLSTKYMSHVEYHFAFDYSGMDEIVESKVKILKSKGINKSNFYVLVGCKDRPDKTVQQDIEDALYRLNLLKSLNQNACVMRYQKIYEGQPDSLITEATRQIYVPLANWGNVHQAFHGMEFLTQYLDHERGKRYKHFYKEMGLIA